MASCPLRHTNLDAHVRFRAPAALVTAAENAAYRDGISVSEYLRTAVRRQLGRVA